MAATNLLDWHRPFADGVRWRLTDLGVEVEGAGVERTKGEPATVTRVWRLFGAAINQTTRRRRFPAELVVATICTESGGRADAVRLEPGYVSDEQTPHKVSPGLMQTLISTAREALQMTVDRAWLLDGAHSIEAGCAYLARQSAKTSYDPPLVAAAYNSGGIHHQTGSQNRWKLRQFPIGTGEHCDRFARFYNDAVVVLGSSPMRPTMSHQDLLREQVRP
ncbi:transglycosylase SLT domain-containing protein [Streptomyces sp. NPDC005813]|uniref:transglycosylase SLT domain-containing protein n=1 Tax=Streptomyces sp. NPDC005813 TaxID=3155592 RepID=UPI0033DC87AC